MSNAILDNNEPLVSMAEGGRKYDTHPATLTRWCASGIATKSGPRVRLEHVRRGGKLFTSIEALKRFFTALSDTPADTFPTPTPAARRRSAEAACAELIAAGA